ncbi:MAG TPA: tripartite tricarboxylate transporter TctB family protein [Methylomirabilota bacterium]|jgi:putative tricarboxylic transport membrane protein|nr:tripartite tricarboxylate transporter TctB family protein [Methylomirabilota bacterium]
MTLARRAAAPLAGVLLSAALLLGTRGLDQVARGGQLGPGFWPRLVLIGLGLACLGKLIAEWRRPPAPVSLDRREPGARSPLSRRRLAAAIAAIVLYVVATPVVGFALATAAFIAVFMSLCGTRSVTALGANAMVGTVLLLYLFIKLVYLPLPKGEGPFEALSLLVYRALRIF